MFPSQTQQPQTQTQPPHPQQTAPPHPQQAISVQQPIEPQKTTANPPQAPRNKRKRQTSKDGALVPQFDISHPQGPVFMHSMTLPTQFQYVGDYTPGGMHPGPPHQQAEPPHPQPGQPHLGQPHEQSSQSPSEHPRTLSSSKRAEQNRKAQRAFRERRDQHVKSLESRSQLLDAALASADEANRRWEECRALVDQLRIENAALRAALSQAQLLAPNTTGPGDANHRNGAQLGDVKPPQGTDELNDSAEASSEKKE